VAMGLDVLAWLHQQIQQVLVSLRDAQSRMRRMGESPKRMAT
jgi:hypothetical protein